jgi:uncharacterized iron-regulated membrane protein
MRIKKVIGQAHLWMGLVLGILFFIIALSGAIYTWSPEISSIIYHKKVYPQDLPFVPVSTLKEVLENDFPEGDFITALYQGRSYAIQVLLFAPGTYYNASMDPYTGELIHLQDMKKGWLNYLKFLHRNLILGDIGREIVHWGTLFFFIMMITGIIMWWPVNKAGKRQRLTIKWSISPKRLNYDLHNVLGFYASWILIFSVLTGLFWSFEIVKYSLEKITGETQIQYDVPLSVDVGDRENFNQFALIDDLMLQFRATYPDKPIRISNPHKPSEPIRVVVLDPKMRVYKTDHYYFDRYTGIALVGQFKNGLHTKSSLFNTLRSLVYDIHLGTVFGLPSRLLVFFGSLIGASLPITGFLVWFNKRKKGRINN